MDVTHVDLLTLMNDDTSLQRRASTSGGEHAGSCPFCGGTDRFRVWPRHTCGKGRYWCRRCGESGDAIDYVRRRDGLSFPQACDVLGVDCSTSRPRRSPKQCTSTRPPLRQASAVWRQRAAEFCHQAQENLWLPDGDTALNWLRDRGLSDATIVDASLGYSREASTYTTTEWGILEGEGSQVYIGDGIIIPWHDKEKVCKIQVRQLDAPGRYQTVTGSRRGLYRGDAIDGRTPVVMVEGVFDALTAAQHAADICRAVATGSASDAKPTPHIMRLSVAPLVLVAFDADEAGDKGATDWVGALPNAVRWRPFWGDVNEMALSGVDIRGWVSQGIEHRRAQ